jgi:photosystem II stability/assembly factor-like uncharacterized protein
LLRFTFLIALCFLQFYPGESHAGEFNAKNKPRTTQQVAGSPRAALLNINNMTMWAGDDGTLERRPDQSAGVQFPRGTTTSIYAGGLLWGGVVTDGSTPSIRVGGQAYVKGTKPGAIVRPGVPESPANTDVRIYRIRRDWATADLKKDASEYYGIPEIDVTQDLIDELRRQYQADWLEWPWQKGAPYYERNGIPGYQPSAGTKYDPTADEPGLGGADQVIWFVANDLDGTATHALYGSLPIGIEQQVTCWAYNSRPDLQNVIFQRHRLIYKGTATTRPTATISPMYIAKWVDSDIGEFSDDLVGSDPSRDLGYAFNGHTNDIEYDKSNLVPPAMGYDLLQGPRVPQSGATAHWDLKSIPGYANLRMSSFTYFTGDSRTYDLNFGNYLGTQTWYNLLRGYKAVPLNPPQCSIDPTTNQCTTFELSGDPQSFRGWVDGRVDTLGDRRFAIITGPFSMALGDTQEVVYSLMGAIGANNRQSVGELLTVDNHAQDTYNLNFELADSLPSPPLRIVELDKAFILDWESDTSGIRRVETYNSKGFKFETYNIYQFASPTATLSQATPFPPYDVSLPRSMNVDNDLIRKHVLVNGQKYYYAVSAQYYNPDPLIATPRIESPLRILTATPHSPNPGVVYPYGIGELATNSANLKHVVGYNDATVNTTYYDPSRIDDHTYKLRFHRSPNPYIDIDEKSTWDFIDLSEFNRAWAVGGDAASGGAILIRSQNGGSGWDSDIRPGTGGLRALSFADVQSGYGVGESGLILKTTNGGESWASEASGTTMTLFGAHMLDYKFASAVGANGAAVTTTNSGATWRVSSVPATDTLRSVSFYDAYRGFAVGNAGTIVHTENGGVSWVRDASGTTQPLYGVSYSDIKVAYAAGGGGTILRSVKQTGAWDQLTSPTTANLRGVSFLDGRTGTVVGEGGIILRTTDRGEHWTFQNSGTTNDLLSVAFSDSLNGISCGNGGTMLQTNDAGATWVPVAGGTVTNLASVTASKELHLLDSLRVDTPPHRVVTRGMHVEVRQPLYGMKGVFESESGGTRVHNDVFNQADPSGKFLVVGKGASDLDTIRGGNASDADVEVRFHGDSSWAVFRRANPPTSIWVRVPYTVWSVGLSGKDSFAVQMYSVITEQGGDSIWRPATILDHPYNGQSVKYFYPLTVINDTLTSGTTVYGRYYDDIPYRSESNITKAYLVVSSQDQTGAAVGIWKAYIGDLDNDAIAAPRGTTIRFERHKYIINRDEIVYTSTGGQTDNLAAEQDEVAKINVFPNPYYGMNRVEVDRSQRFVTFNHLPPLATIRIFNLAGTMVRTIRKDDDTQFINWDLNNERALPVASGVYLAYIELRDRQGRDLGTKTLKLMIVPEVAQHASQ